MAIQTNKALFKVVGNTTSPSTARGYNAVAGEVLSFQLEDSTGVLNALWETYDPASPSSPLSTLNAPTFPFTGSGSPAFTSSAPPFSGAATVPTPSGGQPVSNSYFVRCTVATAAGSQSFTRSINCTGGGARKPVPGEVTENSLRGWADDWASLIENTVPHGQIQIADGIHGAVALSYASAAARTSAVLAATDIYKIAVQTDTSPPTLWIVTAIVSGVGTWMQIATSTGVTSPLVTMTGHIIQMFEAASGLSASGWTDQSPSTANLAGGVNWTVGSDGVSPYAQVSGSQYKTSSLTIPAPGTTPLVVDLIVQQDAYTPGYLYAMGAGGLCAVLQSSSGNVKTISASSGPIVAFPLGAFKRVRAVFTGATSGTADSLTIGATTGTGFCGNSAPGAGSGLYLGASNGAFFTGKWRAAYVYNAIPTGPQATALDAYYASLYGAGILT